MESTPVWWDLHQLGCLLGLKFYRATLLGSDGGYCTGKVCVTLWVVQAVNISFTTATLKCHSNKKSILLPEAKGWQDIKCFSPGLLHCDDNRRCTACLPEFGFCNNFSGLFQCAAHQRISVDSNELVTGSEPTVLNKEKEHWERMSLCPTPSPAIQISISPCHALFIPLFQNSWSF